MALLVKSIKKEQNSALFCLFCRPVNGTSIPHFSWKDLFPHMQKIYIRSATYSDALRCITSTASSNVLSPAK